MGFQIPPESRSKPRFPDPDRVAMGEASVQIPPLEAPQLHHKRQRERGEEVDSKSKSKVGVCMRIRTSGTSSVHILLSHTHTLKLEDTAARSVLASRRTIDDDPSMWVRVRTGTAEITDHWWQNAGGQWQARLLYKMTRRKDAREPLALGATPREDRKRRCPSITVCDAWPAGILQNIV